MDKEASDFGGGIAPETRQFLSQTGNGLDFPSSRLHLVSTMPRNDPQNVCSTAIFP
jgi:hypothetical protein